MSRVIHLKFLRRIRSVPQPSIKRLSAGTSKRWPGPMEYWMVSTGAEASRESRRLAEEKHSGNRHHQHHRRGVRRQSHRKRLGAPVENW